MMNIHVSKLLLKMEDELAKAKQSDSDKEIRERLIVIQSLCEVILDEKKNTLHIPSPQPSQINPTELQKMMGNLAAPKPQQQTANHYQEDDANGDSLFDF